MTRGEKAKAMARRMLRHSTAGLKSPVAKWLVKHPTALEFVEEWLELRERGETLWGVRRVTEYLREHHRYPFAIETSGDIANRFREAVAWSRIQARSRGQKTKGRAR